MGKIFEKYGVNRINLVYEKDQYKTYGLAPVAEEWFAEVRQNLIKAADNGLAYFSKSSIEKVEAFREENDLLDLKELKSLVKEIILQKEIVVDYLHYKTQKEIFGKIVNKDRPLCPLCYWFNGTMWRGRIIYLKVRVTADDRLGIDIHKAEYLFSSFSQLQN